jgi:hypothetical protein
MPAGGAGAEAGAGQLAPGNQGPPAAQQQGQGDACTQEGKEGQQGPTPLHKRLPNFVRNAMMQLLGRNPFNMPGVYVWGRGCGAQRESGQLGAHAPCTAHAGMKSMQ